MEGRYFMETKRVIACGLITPAIAYVRRRPAAVPGAPKANGNRLTQSVVDAVLPTEGKG